MNKIQPILSTALYVFASILAVLVKDSDPVHLFAGFMLGLAYHFAITSFPED